MAFPFFTAHPPPRLFAHRGASGYRPENTLPAFALALEMGVLYLELDVRTTKDGHVIVLHDPTVDRTTDASGEAVKMTLKEMKEFDAGYRFRPDEESGCPFRGKGIQIPTLQEVLLAFPRTFVNIEVKQKDPPMEEALEKDLMRCEAFKRVLLASKKSEIMERIHRVFGPQVATGISKKEGVRLARYHLLRTRRKTPIQGQALQIPDRIWGVPYITKRLVQMAHQADLEVHVWTVNDSDRMRKYLQMGVDGIMTDFPDRFPVQRGLEDKRIP